jgi:hypothetical protein
MVRVPVMQGMPDPMLGIGEVRYVMKDIPPSMGGQPNEQRIRKMLDDGTIKGCVRDFGGERKVPMSAVIEWMHSLERAAKKRVKGDITRMDKREAKERGK